MWWVGVWLLWAKRRLPAEYRVSFRMNNWVRSFFSFVSSAFSFPCSPFLGCCIFCFRVWCLYFRSTSTDVWISCFEIVLSPVGSPYFYIVCCVDCVLQSLRISHINQHIGLQPIFRPSIHLSVISICCYYCCCSCACGSDQNPMQYCARAERNKFPKKCGSRGDRFARKPERSVCIPMLKTVLNRWLVGQIARQIEYMHRLRIIFGSSDWYTLST